MNDRPLSERHAVFIVAAVIIAYVSFLLGMDRIGLLPDAQEQAIFLAFDLFTTGLIIGLVRLRHPVSATLRLSTFTRRHFSLIILLATGLFLASSAYSVLLEPFKFLPEWMWDVPSDAPASRLGWFWFSVSTGVAGPMWEECLFRGVIQPVAVRRFGVLPGIWITSALFGVAHVVPLAAVEHLFWSVAVGLAVHRTGSLASGILLHSANNLISVVDAYVSGEPDADLIGSHPEPWQLALVLFVILVGIGLSVWALKRMNRRPLEESAIVA